MTREDFINILGNKYSCSPDYPWEDDNESAVFRHRVSKKWFALLMNISADKIGKNSTEKIWVVNLKADADKIPELVDKKSIFPAWHMNKKYWITVILTTITDFEQLCKLTERSYKLVMGVSKEN